MKIYIGDKTPDPKPFEIPKALLVKHEYFRTALSSKWREGQQDVLHFPEDSERAWSILLYYFVRDRVEWSGYDAETQKWTDDGDPYRGDHNLLNLTHAFLLADKYRLIALQNQIIEAVMLGCSLERCFYQSTMTDPHADTSRMSPTSAHHREHGRRCRES